MSYQNSKKTIKNYSYYISDKIGDGCSSDVYRGLDQKTKQVVAIKVVPKLTHKRSVQLEMARAEIRALQMLKDSENILCLRQVLQTKNSIYIVTELCEMGTLREVLARERKLSEERAIKILRQIIRGYQAIHGHDLLHRDIKPQNIFLGMGDSVIIGDFGFAISVEQCGSACDESIGSPLYMPLESLVGNLYSCKSDIWAIGMTFLEMLVGKSPWKSKTEKELMQQLQNFTLHLPPNRISEKSIKFLNRVLIRDVDQRMDPEELFGYSFDDTPVTQLSLQRERSESLLLPSLKPKMAISVSQMEITQNQLLKKAQKIYEKNELQMGSVSSTQQHSKSKEKHAEITQSHKISYLQSKATVSSSTMFTSPKLKQPADKKFSGSMVALEETFKNRLPQTQQTLVLRQKMKAENAVRRVSVIVDAKQERITSKSEKEILSEVQSQINYFRFMFKLSKRMSEILKTQDEFIKSLKQQLLYLTHLKIRQIKEMQGSSFSTKLVKQFKATPYYTNMAQVLNQYNERYLKQEERLGLNPNNNEKQLQFLINYCLKVLYQNLNKSETAIEELNRKKGLMMIAEQLLELTKLKHLQQQGWNKFHQDSNMAKIMEKNNERVIDAKERWAALKPLIRQSVST